MSKSKLGYKRNSPYKNEPSIQIDSNRISMDQVDFPILGIGDGGEVKMMYPGEEHLFPNSKKVTEIPMMQQGGKLGGFKDKWLKQKFQDGGLKALDLSKLSKEKYKELYDSGRLATYDQKNDTYQTPVLPEVDISAKAPKSFGDFFDRYGKKKAAETTSLTQAMFAAPAEYLMGLPQAAATYLLDSEKNLEPSKALGVENPWAAMGVDMVADPTNLVGAGLLTKGKAAALTARGLGKKSLKSADNFASEIDWAKWNKEIPNNKPLVKEYNEIEKAAKANGTWMKNPDGSVFSGTPEQFVQQNSENFKKAFPKGFDEFFRGAQHFDPTLTTGRARRYDGIPHMNFGIGSKTIAERYTKHGGHNLQEYYEKLGKGPEFYHPDVNIPNQYTGAFADAQPGMYNLATPKNSKQLVIDAQGELWYDIDAPEVLSWHRSKNPNFRLEDEPGRAANKVTNDDIAEYIAQNPDIPGARIKNVQDDVKGHIGEYSDVFITNPEKARIKSLRHNNGMFDMTNPNIYKALAPLVAAGASQSEYQSGGKVQAFTSKWLQHGR